jgi:HD-like signal output (HDOD) protein
VIGNDPRLTADVLRAANSPQFRGAISINSLGDAIVRLGNKEVMGIVMNATIRASFPATHGFWREMVDGYWDVGVACGRLARQLATTCEIGNPDEAFVAGLLHNIGELIAVCALTTMPERAALESLEPEVRALIASQHQALGQRVLTAWELPIGLARMAGDHHGRLASLETDRLIARCAWEIRTCSEENPLPEDWSDVLARLGLRAGQLEAMLGRSLPVRQPPEEAESNAA